MNQSGSPWFLARRGAAAKNGGGAIAVLSMYSVITQRGNLADDLCGPGSTSTQRFAQTFRAALADDGILIDVDQELANKIYQARAQKPIVPVANSLAASAAYWLGSAAEEFYEPPGGEVGSIGLWSAHEDWSKALDAAGIKTTLISAGQYKTEGNAYEPLSTEAQDFMRSRDNDYYSAFTRGVARNRKVSVADVRGGISQGRVLETQAAKGSEMVDDIATFDGTLHKCRHWFARAPSGRTQLRTRHIAARCTAVRSTLKIFDRHSYILQHVT